MSSSTCVYKRSMAAQEQVGKRLRQCLSGDLEGRGVWKVARGLEVGRVRERFVVSILSKKSAADSHK